MSKKQDNHKIINGWVERNLTQETADGSLSKAFEVDGIIDQLTECMLAGRNPIAYSFNLEPQLQLLSFQLEVPILA